MKTWIVYVFIALIGMLLLAACGGAAEPVDEEPPLAGTEWVLTSLNGHDLVEDTNITLDFAEETLDGFAGCNTYGGGPDSGPYTATIEGTLTIPQVAVTVMLCPEPDGVMEQEEAYIATLKNAAAYRVAGDRLEIENAAGETTLVFTRKENLPIDPTDLVGTEWQLVSLDGTDPFEGTTITLTFPRENRGIGHAGCRGYVAAYEAEGDDVRFPYTAMVGEPCLEQERLMQQEGEYTTILGWATDYRLGEERLEIFTARGETLSFEPLPDDADTSLEGTTWVLEGFIDEKTGEQVSLPTVTDVLTETEITATFEDGRLRGSTGCNTYDAAYTRDGASLALERLIFTEEACSPPIMEQERRYLSVLRNVTRYRITDGLLRLEADSGRSLIFSAHPSATAKASGATAIGRVVLGYGDHGPVGDLPLWVGEETRGDPTTHTEADGTFTLTDLPTGLVDVGTLTFEVKPVRISSRQAA